MQLYAFKQSGKQRKCLIILTHLPTQAISWKSLHIHTPSHSLAYTGKSVGNAYIYTHPLTHLPTQANQLETLTYTHTLSLTCLHRQSNWYVPCKPCTILGSLAYSPTTIWCRPCLKPPGAQALRHTLPSLLLTSLTLPPAVLPGKAGTQLELLPQGPALAPTPYQAWTTALVPKRA